MEEHKAEALFDEMTTFLTDDLRASESGPKDPDDDGLPFESLADFSTEPAEFSEMAERILQKVENLFNLTALYNRHSAKYLKACALLEKGIKYLGSACLTKIALERKNQTFPGLGQLTTMKLYRMVSFNYRKLDAALTENLKKGNDLYPELLDMELRYFSLLRRLRSTEKKIHVYHNKMYYEKEDFGPVIEGNAFSGKSWTKSYTQNMEEAPAFREAPAFPVIKSAVGSIPLKPQISVSASDSGKAADLSLPAPAHKEQPENETREENKSRRKDPDIQNGTSETGTGTDSQPSAEKQNSEKFQESAEQYSAEKLCQKIFETGRPDFYTNRYLSYLNGDQLTKHSPGAPPDS